MDAMGMGTLHQLPPPPRSAPASQGLSGATGYLGGGGGGGAPQRHSLSVRTGDDRWETLGFSAADDMQSASSQFLMRRGLKSAFQAGLVQKMREMVAMGQHA